MRGCFEQYGSVTALIHQAREAMAAHKESKLWALAENEEANVNGKVLAAYHARATRPPCRWSTPMYTTSALA